MSVLTARLHAPVDGMSFSLAHKSCRIIEHLMKRLVAELFIREPGHMRKGVFNWGNDVTSWESSFCALSQT